MEKQIKHNVVGAPFRIGKSVKVVKAADGTFEKEFMGKVGTVIYYDYMDCGQTYPNDPMIGVRFGARKSSVFWREELEAASSGFNMKDDEKFENDKYKDWREMLENEGFDKLLKSLEIGINVFRSDFLSDSPFAELDDMDKLDIQEFVLGMAESLVKAAVEMNQCMTEQQAESKAHL